MRVGPGKECQSGWGGGLSQKWPLVGPFGLVVHRVGEGSHRYWIRDMQIAGIGVGAGGISFRGGGLLR